MCPDECSHAGYSRGWSSYALGHVKPPEEAVPGRARVHAAAIVALTIGSYLPAFRGGFIWDDESALLTNPLLGGWDGLKAIWTTTGLIPDESHYWPLTYTVLWLQHVLWGFAPVGYHAVNVAAHVAVVLLLYHLALRLGWPGAAWGAAFFAVHPVHVEVVAWITEIKDLLAAVFYLMAAHAFLGHRERDRVPFPVAAVVFTFLAMMSKSVAATLPFGLALLLWHRNGRVSRADWRALVPVAAVALSIAVLDTVAAGHSLQQGVNEVPPLPTRLAFAGRAFWLYTEKLVWPADLSLFYPGIDTASSAAWIPSGAALAVTLGLWAARRRLGRGPLAAWLFYAVTLGPTLGLVRFGFLELSPAADRYQYLASAAPLMAAGALVVRGGRSARVAAVAVLAVLSVLTGRQSSLYESQATLMAHARTVAPDSWAAASNHGSGLLKDGRPEEALAAFRASVALNPQDAASLTNIGRILMDAGRLPEARDALERAVALRPDNAPGLRNLGIVLLRQGAPGEARPVLERLVQLRPGDRGALTNLAFACGALGDFDSQTALYRRILAAAPDDLETLNNLAWLLATDPDADRVAEGVALAERAIDLARRQGAAEEEARARAVLDAVSAARREAPSAPARPGSP